ncbi:MAG: TadE-like protein [Clostridia bacterium]|jgi:hypothetical protein|nr:TadE-like protein [Clostridia bacterium]
MLDNKTSRGAITVEAAIVLPVFICVVISLAMLIKLVYIHDVMQHAIDEAANELAAYAYIYHISDLEEIDSSIQDTMDDNAAQAEGHAEIFIDAYETMDNTIQEGKSTAEDIGAIAGGEGGFLDKAGDILDRAAEAGKSGEQLTKENLQSINDLQRLFDEAGKDPRKEAESIAWMLSKGMYNDAKTIIAVPVVRQTVKKYFKQLGGADVDASLRKLNISGGFYGLDFYSSSFFNGNQDIDIVVKYKVELPLPIKLLPDLYIAQRSVARAWLEGGAEDSLEQFDIWALPNKQRGLKIEEMYSGNLPYDFPVIDAYDEQTRTGTSIKSINLNSKTYQKDEALKKRLTSFVDDLKDSNVINYKNQSYSLWNKKLIVVIPKGSINESNRLLIHEMIKYANANGIQVTVNEL